jgi:hypothetical protein
VHGYDACSAKWRDDPVRAAIEKKGQRDAAAKRQADASAHMAQLLKKKLEGREFVTEEAMEDDEANYRRGLELQRKRLMEEGGSESDSESSVFDPFANKCCAARAASAMLHRSRAAPARQAAEAGREEAAEGAGAA